MKAVFFDVGGVLVSLDAFKQEVQAALGLDDLARFWEVWNEVALAACRGETTLEECWRRAAQRLDVPLPDQAARDLWIKDFDRCCVVNEEVLDLAARLRAAGLATGIISNSIAEHSDRFAGQGLYEGFDPVVLSHLVGCTKDGCEIFRYALGRLNLPPDETIFIDDVPMFAESARRHGMHAIVYQSPAQLRAELQRLGAQC